MVRIDRKPDALVVQHGLPATAAEGGVGCSVLDGAITLVLADYRAGAGRVVHRCCEAHSGEHCAWELEAGEEGLDGHAEGVESESAVSSDLTQPESVGSV